MGHDSETPGSLLSARIGWASLFAVVLGGIWLRVSIAADPLWLDELHTAWCVDGDWVDVAPRARMGNQSPLYFWIVWGLQSLFGPGALSLRLFSLCCGIGLLLGATHLVYRETRSQVAAFLVAFLIAFDTSMVFYSTEARPYAAVELMGLLQVVMFWRTLKAFSWARAAALSVVSAILFYLHYTAATLGVAELLFLCVVAIWRPAFLFFERSASTTVIRWLVIGMATALLCLPAVPHLWALMGDKDQWLAVSSAKGVGWLLVERVLLYGLPAMLILGIWVTAKRRPGNGSGEFLVLVCTWAVVPFLVVILASILNLAPLALERYVQVSAVAFPLLIALAVGSLSGTGGVPTRFVRWLQTLGCGLIIAISIGTHPVLWQPVVRGRLPVLRNEDWQSVVGGVNESGGADRAAGAKLIPVIVFSNLLEDTRAHENDEEEFQRYLLFPVSGIYKIDPTRFELSAGPTLGAAPFTERQLAHIRLVKRAFVIIRARPEDVGYIATFLLERLPKGARLKKYSGSGNQVVLLSVEWG